MRAIVITRHGGPEVLAVRELLDPEPNLGEVLIRVKAFGLNRAETYMRRGEWPEIATVSGIECVGSVAGDPSGALADGTRVAALMGGMGRTRNGSYAELVTVPATNVVPLETPLAWTDLAALPEVYATAWTALRGNLELEPGHTLLVRGAASAVGQAAVNIGRDLGAEIVATVRSEASAPRLRELGVSEVLIENGALADRVRAIHGGGVDRVLDLVGNSVLRESLKASRHDGRVVQVGFLGGPEPVDSFLPIVDLPSGVQLSFFGSFEFGTEQYPLADVPLQEIVDKAAAGIYDAKPLQVYAFDEIVDAHRRMDAGASGKLVVEVD